MEASEIRQAKIQAVSFLISIVLAFLTAVILVISTSGGTHSENKIILETKINPNCEPVGSLLRLPGIGISKAHSIVAYREEIPFENGRKIAFRKCSDLEKVKGIGPKTADNLCRYLKFN